MRTRQALEGFEQAIRDRLDYAPETGTLTWREPKREWFATLNAFTSWRTRWGGKESGKIRRDGYRAVRLTVDGNGMSFLAHRVAWFITYGEWPRGQIDHMNGDRADNRLCNLRAVSQHENLLNMKCPADSKTGVPGVTWSKHAKRWLVRVNIDKRTKNLGYYLNFEEAVAARRSAEQKHGYYKNHGKRAQPAKTVSEAYIAGQECQRIKHRPQ